MVRFAPRNIPKDEQSSVAIVEQVKALPPPASFKLTSAEVNELVNKVRTFAVKPKKSVRQAQPAAAVANALQFSIDSLTCNKKSELGKDEINLAGIAFDNVGGAFNLEPFFVGKFKKGDTKAVGKTRSTSSSI